MAGNQCEAWLMRDDVKDQRDENRLEPNVPVTYEELSDMGVWHYHMDPKTMLVAQEGEELSRVDRLAKLMGFINRDEVCCSPDKLPEYDKKLQMFFTEHIHEDDEIRLIKDGSGFFDVRNAADKWVRIWVKAGDLVVIPAGIYHRFTMDRADFTHAIRLFSAVPKWTPINRPCDDHGVRLQYVTQYHRKGGPARDTIVGPVGDNNNSVNVWIQHPTQFDEIMRPLMRKVSDSNGRHMLVLYITGEVYPTTTNSWCPDCDVAKPTVVREVSRVRKAWAEDDKSKDRKLIFVQASVSRSAYMYNDKYLYRSHPFIKLSKGIPTLLVCAGSEDEGFVLQRCDGEVPASFKLKDDF